MTTDGHRRREATAEGVLPESAPWGAHGVAPNKVQGGVAPRAGLVSSTKIKGRREPAPAPQHGALGATPGVAKKRRQLGKSELGLEV